MIRSLRHSLATLILAAGTLPATAVPLLDQAFDAVNNQAGGGPLIDSNQSLYQTFTTGIEGTLASVQLQTQISASPPTEDLLVSILGTSNGEPVPTDVLGTIAVPSSAVPGFDFNNVSFFSVDVSSLGIAVAPGDVLAIGLTAADSGGAYIWYAREGSPTYDGGALFLGQANSIFALPSDAGFRTFVEPIPEPSSLVLLGLTGLLVARRRRI